MRIYMLTDTHFGVFPTRGDAWLEMMMSYMYDVYIPFLRKNVREGDVMLHLGDVFDNRNSINVKVLNRVIRLFEDLASILDVYVLIGNHDMWAMADTTVNSTAAIRNIPRVHLIEEPTEMTFGDKTALLLPWVQGKQNELDVLKQYAGKDLLFCHSDLAGARTQVNPTRPLDRHVCTIEDFESYGWVYSGHIHIHQTNKNFTHIGAPYHMDRNDAGNQKGIYVYGTESGKHTFVPNRHSPEFKLIEVNDEADMDKLTPELLDNNYVDVRISNSLIMKTPSVRTKLDRVLSKHAVSKVEWVDDSVDEYNEEETDATALASSVELGILPLMKSWIEQQTMSDDPVVNEEMRDEMRRILEEADRIRQAEQKAV